MKFKEVDLFSWDFNLFCIRASSRRRQDDFLTKELIYKFSYKTSYGGNEIGGVHQAHI